MSPIQLFLITLILSLSVLGVQRYDQLISDSTSQYIEYPNKKQDISVQD